LRHGGVWFDVGHGQGSFSWRVAETATTDAFWPDVISTDLHTGR
jgi:dihydroorotase